MDPALLGYLPLQAESVIRSRFKAESLLGNGAFASVWKCEDLGGKTHNHELIDEKNGACAWLEGFNQLVENDNPNSSSNKPVAIKFMRSLARMRVSGEEEVRVMKLALTQEDGSQPS